MKDPAIDQSLLGTSYEVTLPMTVIKVTDDYVVTNTATQLVNDVRKDTNQVSNPLKPINPAKDVVVKVDGQSVDGKSIYLNSLFLYRLDSSTLPPDRAYPQVSDWSISDPLDTRYDKFTGQWAVYAARDLIKDGETLAERGERIAGSDFDASRFGGELFELTTDERGVVTVRATELMLGLVSADTEHEQAWTAFIQCQRIAVGGPVANQFTETINGVERPSNTVTTHTPDMTPRLTIEKWDEQSSWPDGDRDTVDEALNMNGRDTRIVFTITNAIAISVLHVFRDFLHYLAESTCRFPRFRPKSLYPVLRSIHSQSYRLPTHSPQPQRAPALPLAPPHACLRFPSSPSCRLAP